MSNPTAITDNPCAEGADARSCLALRTAKAQMKTNTILLVDADGDCEAIVKQTADRLGYDVQLTETSREAFAILRNSIKPGLVVVDVDPGAHGLALLEAISLRGQPADRRAHVAGRNLHEADRGGTWREDVSRKTHRDATTPLRVSSGFAKLVNL